MILEFDLIKTLSEKGEFLKAIEYCKNSGSIDSNIEFTIGELYFLQYGEDLNIVNLKFAIDYMIRAYKDEKLKQSVMDRFYEFFLELNADDLKENYYANVTWLHENENIDIKLEYEKLPVTLFPIDDNEAFLYNKLNDSFEIDEYCSFESLAYKKLIYCSVDEIKIDKENLRLLKRIEDKLQDNIVIKNIEEQIESCKNSYKNIHKIEDDIQTIRNSSKRLYYMSKFFYEINELDKAEINILEALRCKTLNFDYNFMMYLICLKKKTYDVAAYYLARSNRLNPIENFNQLLAESFNNKADRDEINYKLSIGSTVPCFFPRYVEFYFENNNLCNKASLYLYKYVYPELYDVYKPFVSLFSPGYEHSAYALHEIFAENKKHQMLVFQYIKCEIVKCEYLYSKLFVHDKLDYILPIFKFSDNSSKVYFNYEDKKQELNIATGEYRYFRINKNVEISSNMGLLFGQPIYLEHKKSRKKLVLNVFVDALTFSFIKKHNFEHIPNIFKFFDKGVMFVNNFSCAEHSTPSIPATKTSLTLDKTQIFERNFPMQISDKIKTMAEYYKNEGYFTSSYSTVIDEVFLNTFRGFDRYVSKFCYDYTADEVTEDAINHLRAFEETDNYLEISFVEPHRELENVKIDFKVQTQLPFEEFFNIEEGVASVFQKKNYRKEYGYAQSIKNVDRCLGYLFDYIEENYSDDEFIVGLFSDHGVPILDDESYLLKENQTNTCFCIRGDKIPQIGLVGDEITSNLDFLPAMLYASSIDIDYSEICGKLPKCLGGDGREYAISESIFPGQTYKLNIRSLKYEFRLETDKYTEYDGMVNFDKFKYELFDRNDGMKRVRDLKLEEYFIYIAHEHVKNFKK